MEFCEKKHIYDDLGHSKNVIILIIRKIQLFKLGDAIAISMLGKHRGHRGFSMIILPICYVTYIFYKYWYSLMSVSYIAIFNPQTHELSYILVETQNILDRDSWRYGTAHAALHER